MLASGRVIVVDSTRALPAVQEREFVDDCNLIALCARINDNAAAVVFNTKFALRDRF